MRIVKTDFKKLLLPLALLGMAGSAMAGTYQEDEFSSFYTTIRGWTSGGLGMGIASTMLLLGSAVGVAKNSPMPALTGVAGAAFLHWGPGIIENIMTSGLVM